MKKHIPTITIFIIIIGVIALGIYFSERDSTIKELAKIDVYSKEELSFLEEQGFLNDINSENLPSNKEQIISLFKSSNLIEQNLNSPDESFEVLATKLDKNTYQLAFKLENKSNQSKEFYLIPISESSQTEFKEIKGVVKDGKVSWGNQGDWGYDIEKHKQELRPELAKAYDDIDNNGYAGKPIKLVLEANSTLLAQSKWEIRRDSISTDLEPIYLLVYGSAGGVKDGLTILTVHSSPQQGENWEVSFTTRGTADLTITPDDQATIDDMDFISLKCGDKERTPQILENDVIFYPNWFCFEEAKVVHIVNIAAKHTLKFQFGEQTAYAYNNPGLIDDLVSYWRLDDNLDTNVVIDIHSTNEGTVVNDQNNRSSEQSTATAKLGTAFDLDGSNDYVNSNWNPTAGNYTVTAWVKFDSLAGTDDDAVIVGAHDQNDHRFYFGIFTDNYYIGAGDSFKASVAYSLSADTWYFFTYTLDGSTATLYIDTVSKDTLNYSWSGNSSIPAYIGQINAAAERYINGIIDEVAIWSRVLSPEEISDLYNQGNGLAYPFDGIQRGVVSHWKLDEGSGDAIDAHGSNDLTVDGATQGQSGKINDAYSFAGDNDKLYMGATITEYPFTVSAWVYPGDITTSNGVVTFSDVSEDNQSWGLVCAGDVGGDPIGAYSYDGAYAESQTTSYSVGEWQHVVGVWASATSRIAYLNGVAATEETTNVTPTGIDTTSVGVLQRPSPSGWFNGSIDEVTIWNRALTQPEITALYNRGNGLAYPFSTSTITLKGSTIRIKGAKVKIK